MTTKIMGTCAALLLGATLASAQAPDTNRNTIVTFSAPVQLPGVTLPAGSYLFRLADSQVNRNIVQVFDKDRTKIFATILAIPAERTQPADETVITFREAPANSAPAVQYWYYPGERTGQEFAYPKKQAVEIANATHTSVLSMDNDDMSADAMKSGKVSRVEPSADANASMAQGAQSASPQNPTDQPTAAASTATQPTSPTPQPESATAQAAPQSTPAPAPAQSSTPSPSMESPASPSASSTPSASTVRSMSSSTSTPSRTEGAVGTSGRTKLPKTASTVPLVGFAGLLALGSAFGVRALRRAHA